MRGRGLVRAPPARGGGAAEVWAVLRWWSALKRAGAQQKVEDEEKARRGELTRAEADTEKVEAEKGAS